MIETPEEPALEPTQDEPPKKEPIRILVLGDGRLLSGLSSALVRNMTLEVVQTQPDENFGGVELEKILLDDIAIRLPAVPEEYLRPAKRDRSKKNEPWYRGFDKRTGRYR